MQLFGDTIYAITNYNQLDLISLTTFSKTRSIIFADQKLTSIHITATNFFYGDQFNYLYKIEMKDLEVLICCNLKLEEIPKKSFPGHTSWILNIVNDDRFLYTCSDDKTVRIWELENCTPCVYPSRTGGCANRSSKWDQLLDFC